MKFIKFSCDVGYSGCDGVEYYIYPNSISNKELDDLSEEFAYAHAGIYDYLATDEICEEDYDTEAEYEEEIEAQIDAYYEHLDYTYEELSPKEWLDMTDWSNEQIIDRIFEILQEEYNS